MPPICHPLIAPKASSVDPDRVPKKLGLTGCDGPNRKMSTSGARDETMWRGRGYSELHALGLSEREALPMHADWICRK